MNRRNFVGNLLKVGAAFSILPAATLYARKWKTIAPKGWEFRTTGSGLYYAEFKYYFIDMPMMCDEIIFHERGSDEYERCESLMAQV